MRQNAELNKNVAETERGGDDVSVKNIVHKLGLPAETSTDVMLNPGSGSWMFNSIESRARHGLTPTHVPRHEVELQRRF